MFRTSSMNKHRQIVFRMFKKKKIDRVTILSVCTLI